MYADHAGLLGLTAIAAALVLAAVLVVVVRRSRQRDEIFVGLTPGLLPGVGQDVKRQRVRGLEWKGAVAARFTPPDGATPGTVGTVLDGTADKRDVSASILDLAVRGWFTIREVVGESGPDTRNWQLSRPPTPPTDRLTGFEQHLIDRLFASGPTVRLLALRGSFGMTMREAQVGLYRDCLERGWYRRHPSARNSMLRKVAVGFLVLFLPITAIWLAVALFSTKDLTAAPLLLGVDAGLLILAVGGATRTPRTAEGSAARIQAMGFRRYIETAEARQIRFEEAQSTFSRYLPYVMAFGLASVWVRTFAEVAVLAQNAGYNGLFIDFGWLDLVDLGSVGVDLASGVADVAGLAGSFGDIGDSLGAAFTGLSGAVDGAGAFVSSATGLFDLGDAGGGCDLDGCDLNGCN